MRILLTADPGLPVPPTHYGGIERIVGDLAVWLGRQGMPVGLVAQRDSAVGVDRLFPWATDRPTDSWRGAITLSSAASAFQPDIIHSFSRLAFLIPQFLLGSTAVMSYQRSPTPRTVRWASRLGGKRLAFTGCSSHIADAGRACGGRWRAIPNFVDLARLPFSARVPEDAPLVFLSRVESIKGPDVAIEIARAARRSLVIAGNHAQVGPEADFFATRVEPWIGRDGIEYAGPVNDAQKAALLSRAAALLVPVQWDEPFGIVFAEALACGTPVVSCARGALPEIVTHGSTGYLVASVDDGVAAVKRLASIDRHRCRDAAERRFSIDVVGPQYLRLYEELSA